MESHCLKHQGRVATKRCVSCLKPLCEECSQLYPGGTYCGERCFEAAQEAEERAAKIAVSDAELKEWKQKQMAIKMVLALVTVCILFFGWEYFPDAFTSKVDAAWEALVDLPNKISKKK